MNNNYDRAKLDHMKAPPLPTVPKQLLKPCPFCGGKAVTFYRDQPTHDSKVYGVTCMSCSARVFGYSLKEAAAKAWNRRADNGNGNLR